MMSANGGREHDDHQPKSRSQAASLNQSARRTEILLAAARLFEAAEYSSTSVDDIAGSVGLSKPSLYHYYSSKEQILGDIYKFYVDTVEDALAKLRLEPDPMTWLRSVCRTLMTVVHHHRAIINVFRSSTQSLPTADREWVKRKREEHRQFIESAIEECVGNADRRGADARLWTLVLIDAVTAPARWYDPDGPLSAEELADLIFDTVWFGIAGDRPQAVNKSSGDASSGTI